jgi:peptidoglycan/LPS O-acetylase OafA/YrhL
MTNLPVSFPLVSISLVFVLLCVVSTRPSLFVLAVFLVRGIMNDSILIWRFDLYYFFPILFVIFSFSFNKGIISKIIDNKIFVFLGEASYVFYMVHQIILSFVKKTFYTYIMSRKDVVMYSILALIITLIISSILHVFIEKPLNIFLRRIWNNKILPKLERRRNTDE